MALITVMSAKGAPGTTTTRVFQCRPSVWMHHQRRAWESTTSASIVQPSQGMKGRSRSPTSTRHPTSSPVWSSTIGG